MYLASSTCGVVAMRPSVLSFAKTCCAITSSFGSSITASLQPWVTMQAGACSLPRALSHLAASSSLPSAHSACVGHLHEGLLATHGAMMSLRSRMHHTCSPVLQHAATAAASSSQQSPQQQQEQQQQPAGKAGVSSVEELEKECWSCQHHVKRGTFACTGCEKIQPVDSSLNYFELLGMPNMAFDLDLVKLERQYKLLQWHLHPDKVVQKTEDERIFAAQQASLINHAYSVLRMPLSRANYMLTQKGLGVGEGSERTITDPELLMQVLEAREEVEGTDDVARLQELLDGNRREQAHVVRSVSAAFREGAWQEAAQHTAELTYLVRLEQEITHKLPTHS